jgi:hypothetical protein
MFPAAIEDQQLLLDEDGFGLGVAPFGAGKLIGQQD